MFRTLLIAASVFAFALVATPDADARPASATASTPRHVPARAAPVHVPARGVKHVPARRVRHAPTRRATPAATRRAAPVATRRARATRRAAQTAQRNTRGQACDNVRIVITHRR